MPETIIPIWPGSSSFAPGDTPFGFYDADPDFSGSADKVAKWCAQRLGYPIVEIELQDINFYTAFEEAVTEYSNQVNQYNIRENMLNLQGASASTNLSQRVISNNLSRIVELSTEYGIESGYGGPIAWKSASLQLTRGVQRYDLSSSLLLEGSDTYGDIEIKKIYHQATPAMARYFDPFVGTGMGSMQMLEQFGWGNYSPGVSFMLMPIYGDLLRLQAIEFNDQIRRSAYGFELHGNRLTLSPIPNVDMKLWIEYIVKSERSVPSRVAAGAIADYSNVPYNRITYGDVNHPGRQWILMYTLALCKEMLGYVRTKYSTIPIPNSETTLNGAELLQSAQAEKDALIAQLRENLDASGRLAQLERKASESEQLQNQLNKIPLPIFVL